MHFARNDSPTYRSIMNPVTRLSLLAPFALLGASTAFAQGGSIPSVVVTLENVQPGRGIYLTPPWIGIHDGTFDTYDGGQPASVPLGGNEIEALAEDGNNAPLTATFSALQPNAPQREGVPGPFGPLGPRTRTSVTLQVDPSVDRYFSYASMVIPSNDTFIANGNPLAHQLFDASGQFVGQDFVVSGDETNDAGTEVHDEIAANTAFLAQAAPNTGTTESLPVMTPSPGFAAPGTFAYPDGILNYPVFANGDFNDDDDRLLRVRFRFVDLGGNVVFQTPLQNQQEAQADEVDTGAVGMARAVSNGGSQLGLLALTQGLSGPLTAAHLHLGAPGTNGPVIADLTASIMSGGMNVRGLVDASSLTGPLAGQSFLSLLNEMAAGNVYVNLHTAAFPAGELRGQLSLAD